MDFYRIDYIDNSWDSRPKLVTNPLFLLSLMRQPAVEVDIRTIRTASDPRLVENAKRRLPAVVWGGHFGGGVRRQAQVESSGLFCQDIDHISQGPAGAMMYYDRHFGDREDELGIVFAHVSPSGTGLHVVCLCQQGLPTIADNQAWLAQTTQTAYDPICKDMGRIFYLGTEDEILYNDLI